MTDPLPSGDPDWVRRAIAEPAKYDDASGSQVVLTGLESLALASRRMRRQAGLSQRGMAAKAEVSKTTIAKIETATVDPTVGTVVRLAAASGAQLVVAGLEPTTFVFGLIEQKRDRADRHAPPHRLSSAGLGYWDTSLERALARATRSHQADLTLLMAVAAARAAARQERR